MDIPVHHIIFSFLCGLLILAFVIGLIRRSLLQERYAVLWFVLALVFMTYGWWVSPVAAVANWLQIGDVVPVVLFLGIFMCTILILELYLKLNEFAIKIKNLIQEISILRFELESHKSETASTIHDVKDEDI